MQILPWVLDAFGGVRPLAVCYKHEHGKWHRFLHYSTVSAELQGAAKTR